MAMKILAWSLAVLLLAGMSVRGDEPSTNETLRRIKQQEVERARATEAYYRKAGKASSAEYYRRLADRLEKPRTIYVPVVKVEGLSRDEAIMLTEMIGRGIERQGLYKLVGSPDEADFIFEGSIKPAARPKR
jgi:hypothetical protein